MKLVEAVLAKRVKTPGMGASAGSQAEHRVCEKVGTGVEQYFEGQTC